MTVTEPKCRLSDSKNSIDQGEQGERVMCRWDATCPFFHNRVKLMNILAEWQANRQQRKFAPSKDDLQEEPLVNISQKTARARDGGSQFHG